MAVETPQEAPAVPRPRQDPLLVLGGYSGTAWGLILFLLGLAWLGKELGFYLEGVSFWPVVFLVTGLALLAHYAKR